METLATVAFSLAVIAYSVASTQFFLGLVRRDAAPATGAAGVVLGAGAGLHFVHIVTASFFTQTCPVESMRFALSLAAWVTVAAFLVLRRGRRVDALGSFVGPLALTFLVAAQFVDDTGTAPEVSRAMLALHITANLVGLGFVLLAGGSAAFYLLVEKRLKAKKLASIGRLPSLDTLDRLGHRLLLIGFPLLTFGAVTGGMFASQLELSSFASLARAVLGYAAWIAVATVLILRVMAGWSGRRTAYGTLTGVLCVWLVLVVYMLRPLFGGST